MGQSSPSIPAPAAPCGDIDTNVSSTARSDTPSLSHVAVVEEQEQMRDEELCAEIIRARCLSSPRKGRRTS